MDDLSALGGQTILITGAGGMLGRAFVEALGARVPTARVLARDRAQFDVTDLGRVMVEARERPNIIVHCAGLVIAEQCEREPEAARRVHVMGTANVARCAVPF